MERIVSIELVVIATLLWIGYIGSRLAKRFKLPEVTVFILLGIIFGPYTLKFITPELLIRLDFINPIALGLITFGIGERLYIPSIKEIGFSVLGVAAAEALGAALLVSGLLILAGTEISIAILLGTIAAATAPMTVRAVLNELRASGKFSNSLITMVALNNFISLSLFTFFLPFAVLILMRQIYLSGAISSAFTSLGGAIFLGFSIGIVLSYLISRIETSNELMLFVVGHVLLGIALAELFGFSLLLTTLTLGLTAVNLSSHADEKERIFSAINIIESIVFVIFFILAGASMHIDLIPKIGLAAIIYIIGRSIGKIGGSISGAYFSKNKISGNSLLLGFGLLPQGGIAIGLAIIARDSLGFVGEEIVTTVLTVVAFFELVGPMAARFSITKSGEAGLAVNEIDRASHLAKKSITKILVPTAGPLPAINMVETIKDFSLKLGAEILVIYIQRTKAKQDKERGEAALDIFRKLENEGVKIDARILNSEDIPAKIIEVAKSESVDLIVMGATRANWIKKRMVGSVNQKVLQNAPCPVLEVPFEKKIN